MQWSLLYADGEYTFVLIETYLGSRPFGCLKKTFNFLLLLHNPLMSSLFIAFRRTAWKRN